MKKNIDLCSGPLFGKIWMFAIPLICTNVLQLLFNAADVVVVGRFAGTQSLAAVGSTTSLIQLLVALFVGLSVGANVSVANAIGSGRYQDVEDVVHTSIALSLVSGVLLTVVGVIGAPKILLLMNSPEDVISLSAIYLRIYFLGMTGLMVYNFGSAILRASGDTKRPMFFLIISGIVNVVLNLILVIFFHLGVAGVGIASAVSQWISAILILYCLMKEKDILHLSLKKLAFHRSILNRILNIGLPAGLQGMIFSLSNVVIQSSINTFGSTVIAGNSAALSVEGFLYVSLNAFHHTAITFNGQNMGAGEYKRVDRITGFCMLNVFTLGLVLGIVVYFFGDFFLGIYSPNKAVIEAGMIRFRFCTMLACICGLMDVMPGCLRGIGYSVMPMLVSAAGGCGLRLLWVATIFAMNPTIEILYLSYPVSWAITFLVHIICYWICRPSRKLIVDN